MEQTMRKFGWFTNPYGSPTAKTWDSNLPTPAGLIGGTLVEVGAGDQRTLGQLIEEYPCPKFED
jgi:hypothetical protein